MSRVYVLEIREVAELGEKGASHVGLGLRVSGSRFRTLGLRA